MSASVACPLLAAALYAPGALGMPANQRFDAPPRGDRMVAATAVAGPQTPPPARPAKGRFLVASHSLADPNFAETVVLLIAYEPTGAMGVVINRPSSVRLESVLRDVEELRDRPDPVYFGGPVAGSLLLVLVRATQPPESSEPIFQDVYLSGSRAALRKALTKTGKGNRVRGYAGHAGWGPGQLDREIARGGWHVTAADATMIFDMTASAIWPKLIQRFSDEWTRREAPTEPDGLEDLSLRPTGPSIFPDCSRPHERLGDQGGCDEIESGRGGRGSGARAEPVVEGTCRHDPVPAEILHEGLVDLLRIRCWRGYDHL
jgi:putative transcriptional regulator